MRLLKHPLFIAAFAFVLLAPGAVFAQIDQSPLSKLLLSGAWCSFSYNKTTGYSNSTRYQFFPNGTFRHGRQAEGSSSGRGGSMASQSNSGASGRWTVQNGILSMSEGNGALQPVQTQLYRNSSGYPVIKGDGVEYTQCR